MAVERQSAALPPAQPSYILRGHVSQVHTVQFVRQNTHLITGDADGWVIYWKLETKRALAVWRAHDGPILGTAEWAHDKIITHGRDNNLRIWQMRTEDESLLSTALPAEVISGDRPMPWLLHTLPVNTLNFCAFSMCSAVQRRAHDHDSQNDETQSQSEQIAASIIIAVPARDDKKAEVYQFPEERLRHVVPRAQSKDTGMIMAIKLAQNPTAQRTIVITGYEGGLTAVHVLQEEDGSAVGAAQLLYLSQPHTQPILSLDVTPDASMFFTSGADAIVAAHRLPDLTLRLEDESPPIHSEGDEGDPPFSIPDPDNHHVTQSAFGAVNRENTASADTDDPPISIPYDIAEEPLSFSKRPIVTPVLPEQSDRKPGGLSSLLADHTNPSTTPRSVSYTPSIQTPYKFVNTKHAGQQSLSIRSDGRVLATGGWDSRVRIYSTKTLKELAVLKWHKEGVYAVAFADILDTSIVKLSKVGGEIARKETGLNKLQREREEKMQVKHWVAAGAKDGKVSLWDIF